MMKLYVVPKAHMCLMVFMFVLLVQLAAEVSSGVGCCWLEGVLFSGHIAHSCVT
jgi:hypothetical protein